MKAAVFYRPGDLRLEERAVPKAVRGSVVMRVEACAVCGSDLRIYREGNARITKPRIIGHEIAGTVFAVGEGVDGFQVGQRLSVGADVPCGKCAQCLAGRANCCEVNLAIGYQLDGGFAEYIRLDPIVVELGPVQSFDDSVAFDAASLAEPLACCINGYERALYVPGGNVAIFGAGPIGVMLGLLGQQLGAQRVLLFEPNPDRRARARELGFADVYDPHSHDPVATVMEQTGGDGADAVFTANPVVETHEQAIAMVARRGVVNLFGGLPAAAPPISLLSNHLHYREAYVTGSHGSTPAQHAEALRMIVTGELDIERLVTHRFPLEAVHDGIAAAMSGRAVKVLIKPGGAA